MKGGINVQKARDRSLAGWWKRAKIWQNRYVYLMLLPVMAYFLIFKYWPMGWISIAFYDYKLLRGFAGSKWVGLKHFISFMGGLNFGDVMRNTLALSIESLIFSFPIPIIFALMLNDMTKMRFKKLVQTISYLPHFLSIVVIVALLSVLLSPSTGYINHLLSFFGMEPIYFLGNPKWFRFVYIVSGIWQETGWGAIIYISALSGIDQELYEAARVDGASKLKQTWHISLPGIRETIILLLIMRVGNLMKVSFEKAYLMQNDLNISVSETLATYTYKVGLVRNSYSLSTAINLFQSVVSLILILIANTVSSKLSETSLF